MIKIIQTTVGPRGGLYTTDETISYLRGFSRYTFPQGAKYPEDISGHIMPSLGTYVPRINIHPEAENKFVKSFCLASYRSLGPQGYTETSIQDQNVSAVVYKPPPGAYLYCKTGSRIIALPVLEKQAFIDNPGQSTPAKLGKICPDEYAMHLWALAYDRMDQTDKLGRDKI